MKFEMNHKEKIEANKCINEHNKECELVKNDINAAIGGRISYTFTSTGLGVACGVKCACGWHKECTDVSKW